MISCLKIPFHLRKRKRPMDCPEWSRGNGPREAAELGAWRYLQAWLGGVWGGGCQQNSRLSWTLRSGRLTVFTRLEC